MEFKFSFNGVEGTASLKSNVPNQHGNICAEITWGELVMRPTFRSEKDFLSFLEDDAAIAREIDESCHCPDGRTEKVISRYDYHELREKAISPSATQKDLENLWNWFESFDPNSWNGECYNVDGYSLSPIWQDTPEGDDIVVYELRY